MAASCNCGAPGVSPPTEPPPIVVPPPPENFNDTALGRQIRQDYFDKYGSVFDTVNDYWISGYYGTYGDCVVLIMSYIFPPAPIYREVDMIVGETLFRYNLYSFWMVVWKEGKFYEIRYAYDQGLLTNEDIRSVAAHYYGNRVVEEMNLKYHAGLRANIIHAVRSSFYADFEPYFHRDFLIKNMKYYGSYEYFCLDNSVYNDHVAVMITVGDYDYADAAWEETVADTLFRYNDGNRIFLWKMEKHDGQVTGIRGLFYELQDAYDLGLLNEDDLRNIAHYHETGKTISY